MYDSTFLIPGTTLRLKNDFEVNTGQEFPPHKNKSVVGVYERILTRRATIYRIFPNQQVWFAKSFTYTHNSALSRPILPRGLAAMLSPSFLLAPTGVDVFFLLRL